MIYLVRIFIPCCLSFRPLLQHALVFGEPLLDTPLSGGCLCGESLVSKTINVMFFGFSYIVWFGCGITSKSGVTLPLTVALFVLALSLPAIVLLDVWNFFSPFLSRLLGSPFVLSFSSVLFPLSSSSSSSGHRLSKYLIATIVYFAWLVRNLATFRNSSLGLRSIINMIIKDIKLRILGDSVNRVRDFWSACSVICSV